LNEQTTPGRLTASTDELEALDVAVLRPSQMAWRRYWRHRGAAVSTVIMIVFLGFVLVPGWTARYGINEQVLDISEGRNYFLSPRSIAWFGTDDIGNDIYSRLIYGVRTSVFIGVASALLSVVIGTTAGAIAGLRGGRFDEVILREFMGNVKWITNIIGEKTSIRFIIVLFAVFGWMTVARLVRGQVLALKEREFIEAARAVGATNTRIVLAHLIPNSIGPILVALTLSVTGAIIGESTLSFFGLGPQPGTDSTSLGKLVELSDEGARQGNWWLVVFPCGALVLLAICINFIGDGLRDAFDAKMDHGS
jgi:ABC-type dipeptide/oligopeptide/nickel transport system permease subunit